MAAAWLAGALGLLGVWRVKRMRGYAAAAANIKVNGWKPMSRARCCENRGVT